MTAHLDRAIHLDTAGRHALAAALGDHPETVIAVHQLRRGLCDAFVVGDPARPLAAMIQGTENPTEPAGFGTDAAALWALLRDLGGWRCVNVDAVAAAELAANIAGERGVSTRLYGDVYHTLTRPATGFAHPAVRVLTSADLSLVEAAPPDVHGAGFGDIATLLAEAIVAGAVIDGRLVAIAGEAARTPCHADVSVATLHDRRRGGLATAAAALVVGRLQAAGVIPVWSCGQDNHASLRVAQKLGFVEISRRTYVILQSDVG